MTILDLSALRQKLPEESLVETSLGTFKVIRLPHAEKISLLALIAEQVSDEEAVLEESAEMFSLWARVIAKCLVDAEGKPVFDCEEGFDLLVSLVGTPEFQQLLFAVNDLNRLGVNLREADLEAAKND